MMNYSIFYILSLFIAIDVYIWMYIECKMRKDLMIENIIKVIYLKYISSGQTLTNSPLTYSTTYPQRNKYKI